MGRRARRRAGSENRAAAPRKAAATPRKATAAPRKAAGGRERALDRLAPARRVLAIYVAVAMVVAITVVLGIAILGGTLGPFLVAAYAMLAAGLASRWASRRLAGLHLTDEDRMMQTMAGGLLVLSVGFALASLVVVLVT